MKKTFPAALAASLVLLFAASAAPFARAGVPSPGPEASVRTGAGHGKAGVAARTVRATRTIARAGGADVSSAVTLPGVPATETGTLTTSTVSQVYALALAEGQRVYIEVVVHDGATNPTELYLWKPGTPTVLQDADWDMLAAEAGYSSTGTAVPLRLAYQVPTGAAGDYYVDVAGWGIGQADFDLSVKAGADAFTVASPGVLEWGKLFTVKGSLEPSTEPGHVDTTVSVWAHWLGLDTNGVDRMTKMGDGLVSGAATYAVSGIKPNTLTMPWTSYIRVEWPGDDNHGWVDESILVRVRAQVGLVRSRAVVRPRTRIRLFGKVNPGYARQRGVTAPRLDVQGRWGTRGFRRIRVPFAVSSSGWYFVFYTPSTKGRWQFRTRYLPAVFKNEFTDTNYARYVSGYSKVITIFVR